MKSFMTPEMKIVQLTNENVFCASPDCPSNCQLNCPDFICNDCVECTGTYHCFDFLCSELKYNG